MKIKAEHIKLVLPWQNLRTSEVVRHKVKVISVICSEKRQKSGGVQKLRIVENQGGVQKGGVGLAFYLCIIKVFFVRIVENEGGVQKAGVGLAFYLWLD